MGSTAHLTTPDSCRHNDDFECASCFDERHGLEHPEPVEGCLACRLTGEIYLSTKATPTKTWRPMTRTPADDTSNNWERGIATDERGMPFIGKGGAPIGVKEYSERRHEIEAHRRKLRQTPASTT